MSTMTDPPPSQSPSEKHCVSCSLAPNSAAWTTTNNDKQNTNNDNDFSALLTSDDPPINNNATLCPDGEVLLSMVFPYHSLMVNYFQEYATMKSALHAEHTKQHFTTKEFGNFFPVESNHSLGSITIQTMTHARQGSYLRWSPKSHCRTNGVQCCFFLPYFWSASHNSFMFCSEGSNLSHNHWLLSQSTVVNGRAIVKLESLLSPEEFNSIKEQSQCRVHILQMRVNLDEYFPDQSFSSSMLY